MTTHAQAPLRLNLRLTGVERASLTRALHAVQGSPARESVLAALPGAGLHLLAAAHLLVDLGQLGWRLTNAGDVLVAQPPAEASDRRVRVRAEERIAHDAQLTRPSVRRFIARMERRRPSHLGGCSIFDVMRGGGALAATLEPARRVRGEARRAALAAAIDPRLEIIAGRSRCPETGLSLREIWRYFRHTWSSRYVSTPGRGMMFLVRDYAAPRRPVMGIGALSSAVVQLKQRDAWLGWQADEFMARLERGDPVDARRWLAARVQRSLGDLLLEDLLAEGLLTPTELRAPTTQAIARLRAFAAAERARHHRLTRPQQLKGKAAPPHAERARSHLFRSKRALALTEVLSARRALAALREGAPLSDSRVRAGLRVALKAAKKERVGVSIAEISVCGALPPYNHLIGGKLISMLACSPQIVEAYRSRYGAAKSEIASAMAGRPIIRPAELVALGTSSLYGEEPNQYTRVRLPPDVVDDPHGQGLRFKRLGRSESFGTSQFSVETVQALVDLVERERGGVRVNSVFGEGVNPRMRKIREGLDALGAPADRLLRHGRRRTIYGVRLARNATEYLLGYDDEPDHLFATSGEDATARVADYWRTRWVAPRLDRDNLLDRISAERLTRPVRHGARVRLPALPGEDPIDER